MEVAKGIGVNATIYSICEDGYTPALNNVINIIAKQLRAVCLPRPLVRDSTGKVKCNVLWELPNATSPHSTDTPVACVGGPAFLSVPAAGLPTTTADGGQICVVNQLAVGDQTIPQGDGWFYDDFSSEMKSNCAVSTPQRISFSPSAKPPSGVTVKLACTF